MKVIIFVFSILFPSLTHAIGEGRDIDWPKGALIEVQLKVSAASGTDGDVTISGELTIRNPSDKALVIQRPDNRLVLAFVVFDPLGNLVVPKGMAKVNPGFGTHSLAAHSAFTHHFESLDFITGSARFGYELSSEKSYKVLAVYRPAGPNGPGFSTQEVALQVRQ